MLSDVLDNNYDLCVSLTAANIFLYAMLVCLLVALSADRYWAVSHPISYYRLNDNSHKKWVIFFCCIIGIFFGISPYIGLINPEFSTCDAIDIMDFTFLSFSSVFGFVSSVTIIALYGVIFSKVRKQVRIIYECNNREE
jgi:ABC-type Fe3+ transport system permease subunit